MVADRWYAPRKAGNTDGAGDRDASLLEVLIDFSEPAGHLSSRRCPAGNVPFALRNHTALPQYSDSAIVQMVGLDSLIDARQTGQRPKELVPL
ncbi:hypothetical protein D9M70_634510 [compost metagenome]